MNFSRSVFAIALVLSLVLGLALTGCGESATPTAAKGAATAAPAATAAATKASPTAAPAAATKAAATTPAATAVPTKAQPKLGGTLTYIQQADSLGASFDVHKATNRAVGFWNSPIYESLLFHDIDTFKIIPGLAEKYEVAPDLMSITLYLRKGVKWHNVPPVNGREFTSEDVKWNLERIRDLTPPGVKSTSLVNVKSVETPDKYTVKLIMKQPDATMLFTLSDNTLAMIAPEMIKNNLDVNAVAIGTGPFMLKSYERNISTNYVKNPDYWDKGLPRLDSYKVLAITDAAARLAAVRTGQGDVMNDVSKDDADNLKKSVPTLQVIAHEGLVHAIRINSKIKPLDDVRVRKAINLATDRQELISLALRGDGKLAGYFRPDTVPVGIARTPDELLKIPGWRQPKDQDIAEAKKLMADAGYASGVKIEALVNSALPYVVNANELLQVQLKKIGIDLVLVPQEFTLFNTNINSDKYQIGIYNQIGGDADVLSARYHTKGSVNVVGWGSTEMDKLWEAGRAEADLTKRVQIYRQAEDMMRELSNEIPIWTTQNYMVIQPTIREVRPMATTNMVFYAESVKYAWIDK